ncbi:hypothetical protein G6F32_017550 [Rhizopus arrhizus]|nr:hypothetical protein G6F32_017550 [Rhizopus arrhizus]
MDGATATPLPARSAASTGRRSTANTITPGGSGKPSDRDAATHGVALPRSSRSTPCVDGGHSTSSYRIGPRTMVHAGTVRS